MCITTLGGHIVHAMEQILVEITIFAYCTGIRRPRYGSLRRNIVITFDTDKTRMVWLYPMVKKIYSFRQSPRT